MISCVCIGEHTCTECLHRIGLTKCNCKDCLELGGIKMIDPELELIRTNLRRYTFESPKFKTWVEQNSSGKVLNLFAGKTLLDLDEIRNDIDQENAFADYNMDSVEFVQKWKGHKFDTIILDPPYALRKAMEMYNGNYTSRFKMLANAIDRILAKDGSIISFGYHSTFMGKVRGYELSKLCVFAHGGSQHCTIGIIEKRVDE